MCHNLWYWKLETIQRRIKDLCLINILNLNLLAQFERKIRDEQLTFKLRKEEKAHISPPNWHRRLIFGYVSYNFKLSINWLKKENFLRFLSLNPFLQNGAYLNFDSRLSSLKNIKFDTNVSPLFWFGFFLVDIELIK